MSAPHCPATLVVARHAEAEYETTEYDATRYDATEYDAPEDDSDQLTPRGRKQAAALAAGLTSRRIAAVYASPMGRAAKTGAIVADRLGLRCASLGGVQEGGHGEDEASVLLRFRAALTGVADLHRGETVLVVSHGGAMSVALPRLCANVTDGLSRAHWLAHCARVEVQIGADGWWLGEWPGSLDPAVAGQ